MSLRLVKPSRSSQQLAWIAPPYGCYQLLAENIFRASRYGIKFSSTEERVKEACQHQLPGLGRGVRRRIVWTLGTRCQFLTKTPAAVPPTPQLLLLTHSHTSLSCPSASHSIGVPVYRLSEYRMNLQYFWSSGVRCQRSLCINCRRHNYVPFVKCNK